MALPGEDLHPQVHRPEQARFEAYHNVVPTEMVIPHIECINNMVAKIDHADGKVKNGQQPNQAPAGWAAARRAKSPKFSNKLGHLDESLIAVTIRDVWLQDFSSYGLYVAQSLTRFAEQGVEPISFGARACEADGTVAGHSAGGAHGSE